MADIDNAQLTNFCNEVLRPLADTLARIDSRLPGQIGVYNARNLGTVINDAGAGNNIADGSETDGRTRRTGGDVFNLVTLMQDLQEFFDEPGRRDVITGWQVNALV